MTLVGDEGEVEALLADWAVGAEPFGVGALLSLFGGREEERWVGVSTGRVGSPVVLS